VHGGKGPLTKSHIELAQMLRASRSNVPQQLGNDSEVVVLEAEQLEVCQVGLTGGFGE
jgi:hypothetical protein